MIFAHTLHDGPTAHSNSLVIGCSVPHPAGKMYIQDKVEEYADEVFDLLVGP